MGKKKGIGGIEGARRRFGRTGAESVGKRRKIDRKKREKMKNRKFLEKKRKFGLRALDVLRELGIV